MSSKPSDNLRPAYLEAAKELRSNDEQWAAYESTGHVVVLAGPGSGKTKVLTIKFARMAHEDVVSPRGLACVTYNNECTRELLRRLDRLGVRAAHNVFVGTVHSYCLQNIVRPYARLAGLNISDPVRVATNHERAKHFKDALADTISVDERPSDWNVRCDRYRRTVLDRDSLEWTNQDEAAAKVIEAYERRLRTAGLIDFDDMVLLGLRLVESHKWLRRALIARFPILVVDEYQDLGVPLHRLVLSLCFSEDEENARLFAVGDSDQSIYGFTGARPELLQELASRPEVQPKRLRLNYRSRQEIIRASEIALGEERNYKAISDAVGVIDFHHCPKGAEQQARKIAEELIPRALGTGVTRCLGEIAVLYRTKHEGDAIANALTEVGYDYIRIDAKAPYPKTPLTRWLEDCASWCAGGWKKGTPRLSDVLSRWHGFLETVTAEAGLLQESRRVVSFLIHHRDAGTNFGSWLDAFDAECLKASLMREPKQRDEAIVLGDIIRAASNDGKLADWTVARFGGQGGSPTHVNIMTLHSSKGLEFDVVFMYCMEQGIIPSYREKNPASKKEPRRLFYVGITRARHEVHLTYTGWRVAPWGKKIHDGPSEFLLELQERLRLRPSKDQKKAAGRAYDVC